MGAIKHVAFPDAGIRRPLSDHPLRHGTLYGHAQDVCHILEEHARSPAVFVGHSVSAMIGLLAGIASPHLVSSHVMIGPSPCYINDGDYLGGFSRADIDSLLDTLEGNYLGWASAMAPVIMGAPEQPALREELRNSFCATDPEIAKHFARVTFLSDNRADVPKLQPRTLILQNSDYNRLVRHDGTVRVVT